MFYIIGIALAFFLDLLLISKKGKSTADKILSVWLFLIGLHLLLYYLNGILSNYPFPNLLGIELPMPLLHGPLLFLYTAAATNRLPRRKYLAYLHFLPALSSYLYIISFFLLPASQKVYVYQNKGIGYEVFNQIHFFAINISGVVYTIASIVLLRKHSRNILDQFSYTEKIDLNWLRYIIFGMAGIWMIVIVVDRDEMIYAAVVVFVILLGYFGIKQGNIFTNTNSYEPPDDKIISPSEVLADKQERSSPPLELSNDNYEKRNPSDDILVEDNYPKKKYVKSGLSQESAAMIYKRLMEIMESEKPYTDGELTLSTLAKRLEVHPNILSQVINETEGKNFYDFINSRRIEEFEKLVENPGSQKFTLLALAFECGFNSKTSFNRQFKKIKGISPSEFMMQMTNQ